MLSKAITHTDSFSAVTKNAVWLELAREEKTENVIVIHHDVSPSEFIAQGLQLEEAQYVCSPGADPNFALNRSCFQGVPN